MAGRPARTRGRRWRKPPPPAYFHRSSPAAIAQARQRIQHVIVLMLENRSYDNLFGFLGHPDIPDLRPEDHPNHRQLEDVSGRPAPEEPVLASPTATPRLAFDPPHGHVSALAQMNRRPDGTYGMDGFVTAYAQKLAGREHVPIVHWRAIRVLVAVAAVVVAGGVHDAARRAVNGSWAAWGRLLLGAAVAYVVLAGASHLLRIRQIPSIRLRNIRIVTAVLAVVASATAFGWWHWLTQDRRGLVTWTIAVALAGQGLVSAVAGRMKVQARVPARHLGESSAAVMRCMPPAHIPVLATLAKRYVTCTRWHSSVPGATWPNRNFMHAATSDESVDIEIGLYDDATIFRRLDEQRRRDGTDRAAPESWRIYHHDTPQVVAFADLWQADRWSDAGRLLEDIAADRLPNYAFVEPCHTGAMANSQHPGNNELASAIDFERGEDLVHAIHQALVDRPEVFRKTVLVVTYDEHGGLFDHVPPPETVHPEPDRRERSKELARRLVARFVEHRNRPFHFRVLGPRVPTVIVSPWVTAGRVDERIYDHASVVASLRLLFAPDTDPLTLRDEYANDFLDLFSGPEDLSPAAFPPSYRPGPDPIGLRGRRLAAEELVREEEPGPVLVRDDFEVQLARLNHLGSEAVRARQAFDATAAPAG